MKLENRFPFELEGAGLTVVPLLLLLAPDMDVDVAGDELAPFICQTEEITIGKASDWSCSTVSHELSSGSWISEGRVNTRYMD